MSQHLLEPNKKTSPLISPTKFTKQIVYESTLASNDFKNKNFNLDNALEITKESMEALHVKDGLQSMLAAQMLSIHRLQQKTMAYVNASKDIKIEQYYTNTAIKLSKCFVQQANILAKLQGIGTQKIIVERVDVHQGGQAIVGNFEGGTANDRKK